MSDAGTNRFISVSVDDGHPTDLRTAELLCKHGVPATFYVPARNPERPVLPVAQLKEIAQGFELGGHTMNHVPLNSVSDERVWLEISEGKAWLDDLLGKPAVSFCYPRGKHNAHIAELVKRAGFVGGRTCFLNRNDFPGNPFIWGVSTQAHNHSRMIQVRHALVEQNFRGAINFLTAYKSATDWPEHFQHALDRVQTHGGIAHLYLHSWEIDQNGDWEKLDSVLQSISRSGIPMLTNGELFSNWTSHQSNN